MLEEPAGAMDITLQILGQAKAPFHSSKAPPQGKGRALDQNLGDGAQSRACKIKQRERETKGEKEKLH